LFTIKYKFSLSLKTFLQFVFRAIRAEMGARNIFFIGKKISSMYLFSDSKFPTMGKYKSIDTSSYSLIVDFDYRGSTGDLCVGPGKGPNREEVKYGTINLTDELRNMNGSIIECHYVDHQWIFLRKRTDRNHPHAKSTTESNFNLIDIAYKKLTAGYFLHVLLIFLIYVFNRHIFCYGESRHA